MNNFEKQINTTLGESIQHQEKDGGVIYENLKNAPAIIKTENARAACLVHIGAGRKEQQDRVVFGQNGVASIDGMGGMGDLGGRAAQILAEEMQKGFANETSPEEIHQNAFARMQSENIEKSGACYMAFKINGRMLHSFSAGDVKLATVKQNGEVKQESVGEKGFDKNGNEVVTNALQGTRAGICRIQMPIELEDGDRIFMGSDGFWNQFPGGVAEIADLVKNVSAEKAVVDLNRITMERMTDEKSDTYQDNLNIIVYDFNASFGKGEPSPFIQTESEKMADEDKRERDGIFAHIKAWFKKGIAFLHEEKKENSNEFDWSKVNIDPARRRRILDSFAKKEGAWTHELSHFEKEDPEQSKKENDLFKKFASGEIGQQEISHLLRGIKAPVNEEDDPLMPEKLFSDVNRYQGETLSMPALISELSGTPNDTLTTEKLGQFLLKYPEPLTLKKQFNEVLTMHIKEEDTRDFVKWPEFMRATLWILYGKRAKYGEQILLLYEEAQKKHPKMMTTPSDFGANEKSEQSNIRERIMEANHPYDMEQLYIKSMEHLFTKLKEERGSIDETILFDERFYRQLESDEVRSLANKRYTELSGIGGTYRYNEDLQALAHIIHGPSANQNTLDFSKIKKGPYSVEYK